MRGQLVKLTVLVLLAGVSCQRTKQDTAPVAPLLEARPEAEPIENSGRTVAGSFIVRSVEDQYRGQASPPEPQVTFSFDRDGTFRREKAANGRMISTEAGTYLIGKNGELVLYVERVGGQFLGSARTENYIIEVETADSLTLRHGGGEVLLLQRSS